MYSPPKAAYYPKTKQRKYSQDDFTKKNDKELEDLADRVYKLQEAAKIISLKEMGYDTPRNPGLPSPEEVIIECKLSSPEAVKAFLLMESLWIRYGIAGQGFGEETLNFIKNKNPKHHHIIEEEEKEEEEEEEVGNLNVPEHKEPPIFDMELLGDPAE